VAVEELHSPQNHTITVRTLFIESSPRLFAPTSPSTRHIIHAPQIHAPADHDQINTPRRVVLSTISPHVYHLVIEVCRFIFSISYPPQLFDPSFPAPVRCVLEIRP